MLDRIRGFLDGLSTPALIFLGVLAVVAGTFLTFGPAERVNPVVEFLGPYLARWLPIILGGIGLMLPALWSPRRAEERRARRDHDRPTPPVGGP